MTDNLFDSLLTREEFRKKLEIEYALKQMPVIMLSTQVEMFNRLCDLLVKKGVITNEEIQSIRQDAKAKIAEAFCQMTADAFDESLKGIYEELKHD